MEFERKTAISVRISGNEKFIFIGLLTLYISAARQRKNQTMSETASFVQPDWNEVERTGRVAEMEGLRVEGTVSSCDFPKRNALLSARVTEQGKGCAAMNSPGA